MLLFIRRLSAMKLNLVICVLVSAAYSVNGQVTECTTPDGGVGTCKNLRECPTIEGTLYSLANGTAAEKAEARKDIYKRRCYSKKLMVCCSNCTTPDGKSGLRKPLRECPHLVKMLTGRSAEDKRFVRKSVISQRPLTLCCGTPPPHRCDSVISSLPDPGSRCCGVDSSSRSRITGGRTTSIEEYPWAVLLEYENKKGVIKTKCGGSLINNQFVVTAAHCLPKHSIPINVRVGEFDTSLEGRDFEEMPDGEPKYTEGAKSMPIAWALTHPNYSIGGTYYNDIALIKLKFPVPFTNFVRPICLPTTDPASVTSFIATGWGRVNDTLNKSTRKQAVSVNLFNKENCKKIFERSAPIWDKQLCAGGETGKDSCTGDSGGPLMMNSLSGGPHFELAGVVSFGYRACGSTGVPGIYTNVFHYLDWIKEHMV